MRTMLFVLVLSWAVFLGIHGALTTVDAIQNIRSVPDRVFLSE